MKTTVILSCNYRSELHVEHQMSVSSHWSSSYSVTLSINHMCNKLYMLVNCNASELML